MEKQFQRGLVSHTAVRGPCKASMCQQLSGAVVGLTTARLASVKLSLRQCVLDYGRAQLHRTPHLTHPIIVHHTDLGRGAAETGVN